MSLGKAIKASNAKTAKRKGPIWKGPEEDGITFSLLSRFLVCRERFRCLVVEGLRPADSFNHRIEFGQMWHVCEEALASEVRHFGERVGTRVIDDELGDYVNKLFEKYPTQRDLVAHWSNVVRTLFPLYVEYWAKNPDVTARTPLLQEQVFDVPYALPSGRKVRLRGKWDAVDLIGKGRDAGIYLQENKTKSDINEQQIRRQLSFDLQTMIYLVALEKYREEVAARPVVKAGGGEFVYLAQNPIKGVRYNVIKRPLHRQGKKETPQKFYDRLEGIVREAPGDFFMRWKVEIGAADVAKFRRECLDPILEQVCDWWNDAWMPERYVGPDYTIHTSPDYRPKFHWRHPFGVYNVLDEGGSSDLDEYLSTGSEIGLRRVDKLFEELQ